MPELWQKNNIRGLTMNDFTKEELIDIKMAIDGFIDEDSAWRNADNHWSSVLDKIQSMIEVYDRYQDSECSMKVQVCDE
jgi:hypothetical protein